LGASTLQLIGVILPKFQTPLADGFMSDVDPAFEQQLLYIAVTQRETVIEPAPMTDDLAGETVIFERSGSAGGVMSAVSLQVDSVRKGVRRRV
jgi:hypothetical protein